jgi:hypothetical protein
MRRSKPGLGYHRLIVLKSNAGSFPLGADDVMHDERDFTYGRLETAPAEHMRCLWYRDEKS